MNKFERQLASLYGLVQPLSPETRKWVATNMWLMAFLGAILMVCMMLVFIPILVTSLTLSSAISIISPYVPYYENDQGDVWIAFSINVIGCVIGALLFSFAVSPLRKMKMVGWRLMLWTLIVGLALGATSGIVLYSPLAVFVVFVFVAVAGYFLFETHGYFDKQKSN